MESYFKRAYTVNVIIISVDTLKYPIFLSIIAIPIIGFISAPDRKQRRRENFEKSTFEANLGPSNSTVLQFVGPRNTTISHQIAN